MSGLIYERTPEQIVEDELILARVKKGMALLQEKYGPGWVEKISMENLQMARIDQCILGQIYGEYSIGVRRVGLDYDGTIEHGFATRNDNYEYYSDLDRVWKSELSKL